MLIRISALISLLVVAVPAAAEDDPWSGKASFGYLATSGNTENTSLNTGFQIRYVPGEWAHQLTAQAIYANENEVTTAEAYELGFKSERRLTDNDFLFGRVRWRKDRFSSYDSQLSQTLGYGRRLIDDDVHQLNVEVGAGARQSRLIDGTRNDEFILRGGLDYTWVLSETAKFTQDIGVESGDDNTYVESVTAISARLLGDLALVASYTVKHNTDVLPLTEKTDTYTALSLEYSF